MATPESKVKEFVHRWFKKLRGWSYAPVQNGMGVVGVPDRVGCVPIVITQEMVGKTVGVFVAVECKAPGKKSTVTANQQKQLDGIRAAGGIALVVDNEADLVNPELTLKE